MQILSTEQINEKEKFSYWREVLCQTYTALDPVVDNISDFSGKVTSAKLGEIDVTNISSGTQKVYRTEKEIRKMPNEYYFLNLQIDGQCRMQQDGHVALIKPNEFSIVDSTRPYLNDYFSEDFKQISFRIPHVLLKPYLLNPDATLTHRFTHDCGIATMAIDFLKTIASTSNEYSSFVQSKLVENLMSLVALSLGTNPDVFEKVNHAYQEQLYFQIKKYVREHLHDPELSPVTVANHFRISTRYLHKIFEQGSESFCRYLLVERLESCANQLHQFKSDSVSEIAFRSGFNDTSHFSKVFKQYFNQSPRDYRKQSINQ